MNIDSFENWNQCNRRELLTFISFFRGNGDHSISSERLQPDQQVLDKSLVKFSLTDEGSAPNNWKAPMACQFRVMLRLSTGSAGSAVFVIGRDAFLIRGNSRLDTET